MTDKRLLELERESLFESERAARGEAEAATRAKDEFLATLSHELRNPLAAISNAVRLLELAPPAEPQSDSARQVLGRQVGHLVRLIDAYAELRRRKESAETLALGTQRPTGDLVLTGEDKGLRIRETLPLDPIVHRIARAAQVRREPTDTAMVPNDPADVLFHFGSILTFTLDDATAAKTIVINEHLARRLWPGQEAVGRKMDVNGVSEVIGVVGDVRHGSLEEAGEN